MAAMADSARVRTVGSEKDERGEQGSENGE
jgi:hypothetical protein